MYKWHQILLFMNILCIGIAYGDMTYAQEEEDINYYLGRLYEDTGEETFDPHDMLNYPGQKKQPKKKKETTSSMFGAELKIPNQDSCSFEKLKVEQEVEKLVLCQEQLRILEHDLENSKQRLRTLEKKLVNEGSVDMKAFYLRSVYHLWNVLELKEAQNILKERNEALIRHLTVRVSTDDVNALQNFMEHQNNVQQIDEFLQEGFELHDQTEESHGIGFHSIMEWAISIVEVGKNVEIWLYILCVGFLLLAVWAVYLFIRDIQQELRWMRVIMMMIVLLFFICCLWHWRHMHKVAESRRHAQMMKRGFSNIPEECKPGARGTTISIWEWLKVRAFGAPDVCEKYFEELMIDPSEEITPAMVIAETLAKFFLQPLQHLGSESAKFITNFYQNVPIVYHLPATLFFIVLLIIILFAFCGYGIDFPLWMGGIRPIYRTETADTSDVDRITKEAIAQLKSDREKFMTESRMMLTDIAQAAVSSQSHVPAGLQPLMMMSSNIIESQLESLIARQLSNVITQQVDRESSALNSLSNQRDLSHHNPAVFTVTSTPLRRQYESQRSDSNPFNNQDVRNSNKDSNLNENEPAAAAPTSTLMVATDAVHYRLKGSPRKRELAPKNVSSDSTSGVSSNNENTFQENKSKHNIENVSGGINTEINTDMSVVRRRRIRQTDGCSNASSGHSEPSSSQSLNETSHEAFLSDVTDSGENFLNKVKNLFEDSVNSSINLENSDVSDSDDYNSRRMTGSLTASHVDSTSKEEEIELSASGVRFLGKIKNVMTP